MQADTVVFLLDFACFRASPIKIRQSMQWQVCILLCSDGSLYTGISTYVERRVAQHAAGTGAKYFHGRSPCHIVYLESGHDRSSASRREMAIKKMRLTEKRSLIRSADNQLQSLAEPEILSV